MRQLILQGTLAPGTILNQAEFARALDVSRTPMREAFRMLQEEGLIQAEPDRRAVVVGLDVADLDATYASRILLEALAVRMTVPTSSPSTARALEDALTRMHEHRARRQTSPVWSRAHHEFHGLTTAGADPQLRKLVATLADRAHSYLRLAQSSTHETWSEGEDGHRAVLAAFRAYDVPGAATAMAHHLATTAMRVIAEVDPGRELPAVAQSLSMLAGASDASVLQAAVISRQIRP